MSVDIDWEPYIPIDSDDIPRALLAQQLQPRKPMNPKALYWIDLETTGLDPEEDQILEIGIARASFDNPFAQVLLVRECIKFHDWSHVNPYVVEMHHKSGLMIDCMRARMSLDPEEHTLSNRLQDVICERLRGYADDWKPSNPALEKMNSDELPVLAGSSVHFDRGFLRAWMPEVSKQFSHRYYDVSAIKLFCRSMGMPVQPKAEAHRVVDDIEESIAHAKQCTEWLRVHLRGGT